MQPHYGPWPPQPGALNALHMPAHAQAHIPAPPRAGAQYGAVSPRAVGPGLPPNARPGDWMCRACNNHNYADKLACNRCKVPKDVFIASTGMRVGDWLCPACSNHNFKDKIVCNKCSSPRPASIPLIGIAGAGGAGGMVGGGGGGGGGGGVAEVRPGDWLCRHCANHNFADKTHCNRCKAPIATALGQMSTQASRASGSWSASPLHQRQRTVGPPASDGTAQFEIRSAPFLAKGLGPALAAEHSGLRWAGNASLHFDPVADWPSVERAAPLGQLPLLTVPGESGWATSPFARAGDESGVQIALPAAIVNYIGKVSGLEGGSAEAFGLSQQLLAEGEELLGLAARHLPTPHARLSDPQSGVHTAKGTAAEYARFWATLLPPHIGRLARLCRGGSFQPPPTTTPLAGELHLWAVLYQLQLIERNLFASYEELAAWFDRVRTAPATQRVISGSSPMGELAPYFLPLDSADICTLADERF